MKTSLKTYKKSYLFLFIDVRRKIHLNLLNQENTVLETNNNHLVCTIQVVPTDQADYIFTSFMKLQKAKELTWNFVYTGTNDDHM
jgi:hypothetical protein